MCKRTSRKLGKLGPDGRLLPPAWSRRPRAYADVMTVLGGFVKTRSAAEGIQRGLQRLSLSIGGIGLLVTALLVWPRSSAA
jgi:hypothetical protein